MADEEVVRDEHGYRLVREAPLAVEDWNAQLSLLTGMVAARMMLDGGIGILRTIPLPYAAALEEFRTATAALGMPWSAGVSYGEFLRSLPRDEPRSAAVGRSSELVRVVHPVGTQFRRPGTVARFRVF